MEVFRLTLSQMLMMFVLIAVGFFLRKKSILPDNAGTIFSKAETWIFVPALSLYSMITKCTVENFSKDWKLMLYGLLLVSAAILVAYPLSRLFFKKEARKTYERQIYKYALTFGNFGFMGNFIIRGIWGDEGYYKYALFCFFISICCNAWGLYVLIPKDQNAGLAANLKKGLITPPTLALVAGIVLGLLGAKDFLPSFLLNAFNEASKCQGPVAMVLAGFVIGGYNLKDMVTNKKVYTATGLRLVVLPAVMMVVLKLLGTSDEIMRMALICFATPLGLNTIVYPAAYGGETKTGAAMAMVSHTLSVITIPLMYLLFIEVL